jgi:hypothetical protein
MLGCRRYSKTKYRSAAPDYFDVFTTIVDHAQKQMAKL